MHACESSVALGGILGDVVDGSTREAAIWRRRVCSRSGLVARIIY